ncbi:MAG: IMP dehydrogenase [bacterium]|nr:IMP dehydrogenase [bacterium]
MRRCGDVALTFDDVTLVTQYADFLPSATELGTRFTRRVKLNIPFVSAAMDTVTEARMAIEMARLGGIGVIHRGMDAVLQAKHVARVKHYLNGLISDPIVINENQTVDQVLTLHDEKGYKFMGFPVVNDEGMLTGILTSRDIKFLKSTNVKVKEVMTRELVTAPPGTTLREAFEIMRRHKVGKLPIVRRGRLVGLYSYTDVRNIIEGIEPLINRDKNHRLRVAAAVGTNDYERAERLVAEHVDVIVVDTAHGHSKGVCEMVKWLKRRFTEVDVVAGNVATGEGGLALVKAGADGVKVGIGPGSICTTRVITGVGIPQITAIYEAVKAIKDEVPVISDGGIRHSGDVPKALVAGASSVMMGSVLAGTDESPGEKIIHQGRQYVVYRGMGSLGAMMANASSRERYGQQDVGRTDKLVPEGIEGLVPYAGAVEGVIQQFVGGLRSSLGYNGCRSVEELRRRGQFRRITPAGVREAHPHDVLITKDAPNYRTTVQS